MKLFSHKDRPAHLGSYPLELLKRSDQIPAFKRKEPLKGLEFVNQASPQSLSNAMKEYVKLMDLLRDGEAAPTKAPIPDDPIERANHLKAACYFLDASQVASCVLPKQALLDEPVLNPYLNEEVEKEYSVGASKNAMSTSTVEEGSSVWQDSDDEYQSIDHHTHSLVLLVEYPREPDITEPGGEWLVGTQEHRAAVRAAEVAAVVSQYLRFLGHDARAHTATSTDVDFDQMLLASGLGEIKGANGNNGGESKIVNPFLGEDFGVAVITTTLELADDKPLAARSLADSWRAKGPKWWLGVNGTKRAAEGPAYKDRPYHLGRFPAEKLKRRDEPTTFIDTPNVPRIPKRGDMFVRAAIGDLGKKAQKQLEGFRMITKSPFGHAMMPVLGGLVPMQNAKEAETVTPGYEDPEANAKTIKAALNYLGADMVGICEMPHYAWYSHDHDGSEIEPYHKYGVAILVDQGYETMEGASGDDWISGAQSMRAYMRASLVSGIVCSHIRSLGFSARTHSVIDQDVLHIPILLQAGLGEMSRIGEMLLNPFLGPRIKSGILTTNMPLQPDKPLDFGLQDFCEKCTKCARECPCTAITFGDKVMFNGYEIWKPDSEKCARYRITNSAGSMCGRCMKTCPWNLEGTLAESPFHWAAMNLPFSREWLAEFDDKVGNGKINMQKKWWWDLDTDKQGNILIAKRSNERELSFRPPLAADEQTLGCYPAQHLPPAGHPEPFDVDRDQGKETYDALRKITVADYKEAIARGDKSAVMLMEPAKPTPHQAELLNVKVAVKRPVAEGIVSFELVDPDGGQLPAFTAGSHIDVHMGEKLVRQYSICNDPAETHRYQLGVLKEAAGRGGSMAMHENVNEGDILSISMPRNSFHLKEEAEHYVLLAGGIGVTPILSMARRLHSLGKSFEMHYATRSLERTAFIDDIRASGFFDRVKLHNDDNGTRLDLEKLLGSRAEGNNLYVCGPQGFMDAVTDTADAAGWPQTAVHREYFSADPKAGHDDDRDFQVKLASSGKVYTVGADQTIIDALSDNGIEVPISCEQGICGTCMTGIVEGDVDHRDSLQTDEEKAANTRMTLCCSRAKNDLLVLDL